MTTYNDNFESRLLYTQKSLVEDAMFVSTNLYAVKWNYPAAISSTTARVRITAIYNSDKIGLILQGGTIEKWTDKGWQLLDEYFDAYLEFLDIEAAHNYLMKMCHSFLMGIPISVLEETMPISSPTPKGPGVSNSKNKTTLRVLDFAKRAEEKNNKTDKDNKKSDEKTPDDKSSDEDPDLDWI